MSNLQLLTQEELDTLSDKERKSLYAKRFRKAKLAAGLCTRCGVQPLGTANPFYCDECHQKAKAASLRSTLARNEDRRTAGNCIVCGGTLDDLRYKRCSACLIKMRANTNGRTKTMRKKRRDALVCLQCIAPVTSGKKYCDDCNAAANARIVQRNRETKLQAIAYLGGCCLDCSLVSDVPQVYDFHHLDPAQKDFKPSVLLRKGFETMRPELDKCVLLCANCHRIRHATNPSFEEQDEEAA